MIGQEIIGMRLEGCYFRRSEPTTIKVHTDKGTLTLSAHGDCCSDSWFEHVDDNGAVGGVVTKVDLETWPNGEDITAQHPGYECLQQYHCTIYTTKGRLSIELRNSSNGYYGGKILADWRAY